MRFKFLAGAALLAIALIAALAWQVDEPAVTASGPRVHARLERQFRLGPSPARQPSFSRDGALLAMSNASGDIFVLRTSDWSLTHRLRHYGGATSLAFGADGQTLYSAGYDGFVRRWNLAEQHFDGTIGRAGGPVWALDLSPDGHTLAAAGEDKIVHLWTVSGAAAEKQLRGHDRNIWQARFSPAGDRLATGSFDNSARIWDVRTGAPVRTLSGHTQAVVGLDYSSDGGLIATSGDDGKIRLWRASDGAPLRTIDVGNHTYSVTFSTDGRWLVSAGRARSAMGTMIYGATGLGRGATPIHIWRVGDGALVEALGDETDTFNVAFAPDGKRFVTADDNGVVRLWKFNS